VCLSQCNKHCTLTWLAVSNAGVLNGWPPACEHQRKPADIILLLLVVLMLLMSQRTCSGYPHSSFRGPCIQERCHGHNKMKSTYPCCADSCESFSKPQQSSRAAEQRRQSCSPGGCCCLLPPTWGPATRCQLVSASPSLPAAHCAAARAARMSGEVR